MSRLTARAPPGGRGRRGPPRPPPPTGGGGGRRRAATRGGGAWLVTGEGEEAPGALSSIGTDWCEGEDDNTPDDVATETTSYDYGDAADFTVSG